MFLGSDNTARLSSLEIHSIRRRPKEQVKSFRLNIYIMNMQTLQLSRPLKTKTNEIH